MSAPRSAFVTGYATVARAVVPSFDTVPVSKGSETPATWGARAAAASACRIGSR